jgi:hypothetical protein
LVISRIEATAVLTTQSKYVRQVLTNIL